MQLEAFSFLQCRARSSRGSFPLPAHLTTRLFVLDRQRAVSAASPRRNEHDHYHRGEADVCVLATMSGAIDRGFRVIVVTDAVCSSADETHDATMALYTNRFGAHVETVTDTLLDMATAYGQNIMSAASYLNGNLLSKETGSGQPVDREWVRNTPDRVPREV